MLPTVGLNLIELGVTTNIFIGLSGPINRTARCPSASPPPPYCRLHCSLRRPPFDNKARILDRNISLTWPSNSKILTVFCSLNRGHFISVIRFMRFGHPASGPADVVESLGTSNGDESFNNIHFWNLLIDTNPVVPFLSPFAFILTERPK